MPLGKDDWKILKKIMQLLLLRFCMLKKMYPAYISKHNSNLEKQVILLMIPNGEGWHYPAVKKLSALLTAITSKHHGDFYSLNFFHSFATGNNRESHKKVFEKKDF